MTKDLMRRIQILERSSRLAWQHKLSDFACRMGLAEEELLVMVKGHERQLAKSLTGNGGITWEGFTLFYNLSGKTRRDSPASGRDAERTNCRRPN